jgi:hypothetical protein
MHSAFEIKNTRIGEERDFAVPVMMQKGLQQRYQLTPFICDKANALIETSV